MVEADQGPPAWVGQASLFRIGCPGGGKRVRAVPKAERRPLSSALPARITKCRGRPNGSKATEHFNQPVIDVEPVLAADQGLALLFDPHVGLLVVPDHKGMDL